VTQHHELVNRTLPPANGIVAHGQAMRLPGAGAVGRFRRHSDGLRRCALYAPARMTERQNCTPSEWMISLASSVALRQIVFFKWVTLSEHKWVILAERRGLRVIRSVTGPPPAI